MLKQIVEIPVHALRMGLYVSRLDRPWIESPFLFQGFAIESEEELKQLRELCASVYVEVTVKEAAELLDKSRSAQAAASPGPKGRKKEDLVWWN